MRCTRHPRCELAEDVNGVPFCRDCRKEDDRQAHQRSPVYQRALTLIERSEQEA